MIRRGCMKSVAIKGLKEFELKEIDEPSINGENVVVDVKKAGICGSDIHYWDVGQPAGLVMGHEFCGIVLDPGSRNDLKIGDRVTALPISPCDIVMHVYLEIRSIVLKLGLEL